MNKKNLVLLIEAKCPYIRHVDEEGMKKNGALVSFVFDSISNVYLPLLSMCERLENDGVPFKFMMVITPVLCTLLEDEKVQEQYVNWLVNKSELAKKEIERVKDDAALLEIAKNQAEKIAKVLDDFENKYKRDLLSQFAQLQRKGCVEFLGTCATDVYLPHYINTPEIISAQIETGLHSFKEFFAELPDGFWLPENAYVPGLEKVIRSYGYNYTVLDPRAFLFSKDFVDNGTFYPVKTQSPVIAFAKDQSSAIEFNMEKGFPASPVYRNENRDIGFELDQKALAPYISENQSRFATGFKYYAKETDSVYNMAKALDQVKADAKAFVEKHADTLNKAEACSECSFVSQIIHISTGTLRKWHESIEFIENVFRYGKEADFDFACCGELSKNATELQEISPYQSSSLGTGYGEVLLTGKNAWMMRYLQKACERIVDLADRFPTDTGLKARLLNLGVKELMLAQSTSWGRMIDDGIYAEYARQVFSDCISSFTTVFDSLGSNVVSTEWLTEVEAAHPIFPWMNYRIFSKKK